MIGIDNFKNDVQEWAEEVGVAPKEIHVRDMSRKWASCSSRGRLTFSTHLLKQKPDVRAKAIVHELLHLKYPNHGKMFNTLLIAYLSKEGIDADCVKL
jgi:predicted metal-dependent hydrolase